MSVFRKRGFWLGLVVVGGLGYAAYANPQLVDRAVARAKELPALVEQWRKTERPRRRPADGDVVFDDSEDVSPDPWGATTDDEFGEALDADEALTLTEIDATLDEAVREGTTSTFGDGFGSSDFGRPFDTEEAESIDLADQPAERELDPAWMHELTLVPKDQPFPEDDRESFGEATTAEQEFDPVLDFDPARDVDLGDGLDWGAVDEGEAATTAALALDVVAPLRSQRGVDAVFRVVIRNEDTRPARDVVLVAEIGDGLVMPGRSDRTARKVFTEIPAGETADVSLTLRGTDVGRQCVRFVLRHDDREVEAKRMCLDVRERDYEFTVHGPKRRTVGDRAEYTLALTNVSETPLVGAYVTVYHDDVLEPRAGTSGALRQPGRLVWTLDRVEPRETVQLQVEFACPTPVTGTLVKAEFEADGVVREKSESSLVVEPARGDVEVRIRDDDDPLRTGDETTLHVRVANRGKAAVERVSLRAKLPKSLKFVSAEAVRANRSLDVPTRRRGDVVEFAVLPKLAAGESVVYRVRVQAVAPGDAQMQTIVSHSGNVRVARGEWLRVNTARR